MLINLILIILLLFIICSFGTFLCAFIISEWYNISGNDEYSTYYKRKYNLDKWFSTGIWITLILNIIIPEYLSTLLLSIFFLFNFIFFINIKRG